MTNKNFVSPIGTSAVETAEERAARSAEYRAERERLAFWSDIAAQVILYRTRQGISQAELAKRVGTSHSAISRLESGEHASTVETLRRVAHALGQHLRIELEPEPLVEVGDITEPVGRQKRGRRLVTA